MKSKIKIQNNEINEQTRTKFLNNGNTFLLSEVVISKKKAKITSCHVHGYFIDYDTWDGDPVKLYEEAEGNIVLKNPLLISDTTTVMDFINCDWVKNNIHSSKRLSMSEDLWNVEG